MCTHLAIRLLFEYGLALEGGETMGRSLHSVTVGDTVASEHGGSGSLLLTLRYFEYTGVVPKHISKQRDLFRE